MVKGNLLLKRIGYVFRILFVIKPRLVKALGAGISAANKIDASKPLVVVPLLETNHFQHRHILLMAQGFVMRGYEVLVVVCDEYLPACELKNSRNVNDSNPCFECTTNRSMTLGLFNLNYITLTQVFSEISDPVAYGMRVREKYDVFAKTISRIAEDSLTRYFYGAEIEVDQNDLDQVRVVLGCNPLLN
jgi:hypothetical protein